MREANDDTAGWQAIGNGRRLRGATAIYLNLYAVSTRREQQVYKAWLSRAVRDRFAAQGHTHIVIQRWPREDTGRRTVRFRLVGTTAERVDGGMTWKLRADNTVSGTALWTLGVPLGRTYLYEDSEGAFVGQVPAVADAEAQGAGGR